jgi:hypothetical protein
MTVLVNAAGQKEYLVRDEWGVEGKEGRRSDVESYALPILFSGGDETSLSFIYLFNIL